MNPLLEQFLSESRDFLQGIGEKLIQLESCPSDPETMTELFRFVHTLKGNSGLFELPEMTRVLHAGEDLMDAVRSGKLAFTPNLADPLLDAMDFVSALCDEIENNGGISPGNSATSARLAENLRSFLRPTESNAEPQNTSLGAEGLSASENIWASPIFPLAKVPEAERMAIYRRLQQGESIFAITYQPAEECFFQGDNPLHQASNTPDLIWGGISSREAWPELVSLDAYRCLLNFEMLSSAARAELEEYYRYMPESIQIQPVNGLELIIPQGDPNGGPVYEDFVSDALVLLDSGNQAGLIRSTQTMLELSSPDLWLSSALRWLLLVIELESANVPLQRALILALRELEPPVWREIFANGLTHSIPTAAQNSVVGSAGAPSIANHLSVDEQTTLQKLVITQRHILALGAEGDWSLGRVKAAISSLTACVKLTGDATALAALQAASGQALEMKDNQSLLGWIDQYFSNTVQANQLSVANLEAMASAEAVESSSSSTTLGEGDSDLKFGRRAEDSHANKSLKVDQIKIDRLMNLIGEMVVSKNALPYLASRAESVFGVRELSREIKAQYSVINRIAEEMQDAIMQIRMMPVSSVFQRFPRLVRDISRRLGKDVELVLEGEDTEADKNIIESLGDPLVHIVRNSLDHGLELPAVRVAAGKTAQGRLTIRASQESDRVVIEIIDDGKGIDPEVIKRKALEKGLIDEATHHRLSDQEAINLIFAAGFSTAEQISDLSGRGVGMDVVRSAIERVNGAIQLESEKGKGTRIRMSLPLSMAVTNVMIVESDNQIFGVPMDAVVETVRVRRSEFHTIKQSLAMVLRGRIVPVRSINSLLGLSAPPLANDEDELAVLVVRLGDEVVGLLVDDFRETIDIILKPMTSILAGLGVYSGSALLGDGSVLMVLNVKEML